MKPSDLLGAGIDKVPRHLSGLDVSQKERFIKDMEMEESSLKKLIDNCRLDSWFQTVLDQAKADFEEELAEETEQGSNMLKAGEALDDIERKIKERAIEDAQSRLKGGRTAMQHKKLNRSTGEFRTSLRKY